jgi:hypothetical protein
MQRRIAELLVLGTGLLAGRSWSQEFPLRPDVAPSPLDVPWPKRSFYRQPRRGFLAILLNARQGM